MAESSEVRASTGGKRARSKKIVLRKLSSALSTPKKYATKEKRPGADFPPKPVTVNTEKGVVPSTSGGGQDDGDATPRTFPGTPTTDPSSASSSSETSSSSSSSSALGSVRGPKPFAAESSSGKREPDADAAGDGNGVGGEVRRNSRRVVAAFSRYESAASGGECEEAVETVALAEGYEEADFDDVRNGGDDITSSEETERIDQPPPSALPPLRSVVSDPPGAAKSGGVIGVSRSSSASPPGVPPLATSVRMVRSFSSLEGRARCASLSASYRCDEKSPSYSTSSSSISGASTYDFCGDGGAAAATVATVDGHSFELLRPSSPHSCASGGVKSRGKNGGAWRYLTKRTRPLRRPLRHALRTTWSYFDPGDFQPQSWSDTLNDAKSRAMENPVEAAGLALVGAVVVAHPLMALAGAVWAVGLLKGAEHGYEFFSDGAFRGLFWDDPVEDGGDSALTIDEMAARALFTSSSSASGNSESAAEQHLRPAMVNEEDGSIEVESLTAINSLTWEQSFTGKDVQSKMEMVIPEAEPESSVLSSSIEGPAAPSSAGIQGDPVPIDMPALSADEILALHFPPLSCTAVSNVPFPGLDAAEFFAVFFSDEAPYSLKEFHQNRGDTEISFGSWDERIPTVATEEEPWCLNTGSRGSALCPPPPSSIARLERMLTFKTLTKSYFGPAYASATKTQRASLASRNLLVVENRTRLADIPYGDRFEVLDRWTIVASPEDVGGGRDGGEVAPFTSRLTVTCQVNMIKPCTWEGQIRKKTLSTVTELAESWCEKATKALHAAEKRKKKRLREEGLVEKDERNGVKKEPKQAEQAEQVDVGQSPSSQPAAPLEGEDRDQPQEDTDRLLSLHQKRMQDLEQRIAAGDLEALDSVEVTRKDGRRETLPEFCEVLVTSAHGNDEDTTNAHQIRATGAVDETAYSLNGEVKDTAGYSNSEPRVEQVKKIEVRRSASALNKGRKNVLKLLAKSKRR